MALVEMKCRHCNTVFYGVKGRDKYCYICKIIIGFRKAFGLEDISVKKIEFLMVRDPRWGDCQVIDNKDWRNYIPDGIKPGWSQLSFEARVMAVMFAEKIAREAKS